MMAICSHNEMSRHRAKCRFGVLGRDIHGRIRAWSETSRNFESGRSGGEMKTSHKGPGCDAIDGGCSFL